MTINLEILERKNGKVATVYLNGLKPNNTFDREILIKFGQDLEEARDKADGIILSSRNERFFSNGFDASNFINRSHEEKTVNFMELFKLIKKILCLGKPLIAEITGHAMAGGAVIALACDYRFFISKKCRLGFTEVPVGLPLPSSVIKLIEIQVEKKDVKRLIYGQALKPDDLYGIGLADGIADNQEKLRALSLKKMDALFRLPREAFLKTRRFYLDNLIRDIERLQKEDEKFFGELFADKKIDKVFEKISFVNQKK